jgi:hypothetical protein
MAQLYFPPTCGRCVHWEMTQQIGIGLCYGSPPTPVVIGMTPQGAAMALQRPQIASSERACALYTPKSAPAADTPKPTNAVDADTAPGAELIFSRPDGEA